MSLFIKKEVMYLSLLLLLVAPPPGSLVGQKGGFPSQELETLDGERTSLKYDQSVRYTVLDFWALWCAPCLEALSEFDEMVGRMENQPIRFILVNCDNTRSRAKVRSYIRSKAIRTTVLLDPTQGLVRYYGIATWPHLVVLDSAGNVVDRKAGYMPGDELLLEEKLLELLAK